MPIRFWRGLTNVYQYSSLVYMTNSGGRTGGVTGGERRSLTRAARQLRRDAKRQEDAERKDAVLHLRIEGALMARIKSEARERDMSISDLVRGHLAEHFQADEADPVGPEFLKATYAWVDVNVARDSRCAICKKAVTAGSHAWMAQGPPPPPRVVCGTCYDTLQSAARQDSHDDSHDNKKG
jgi:hypothetical protein